MVSTAQLIRWFDAEFMRDAEQSWPRHRCLAESFAALLTRMPIGVRPGEVVAGEFGVAFADDALVQRVAAAGEVEAVFAVHTPPPEWEVVAFQEFHSFTTYGTGHTCVDYAAVVTRGLSGLLAAGGESEYRDSIALTFRAARAWSARFAALTPDAALRGRLEQVPWLPARNFAEGIQAVWLVHALTGLSERDTASLSLGRLDQYLWPLFDQDRRAGVPEAELERYLDALFDKLNRYGDAACTVNLGGLSAAGQDQCNDLTRMIMRVACRRCAPAPILALRVHDRLSQADFDAVVTPEMCRIGQPSFYGEMAGRAVLRGRGADAAAAVEWAANSCMGVVRPGEEISNMWGVVLSLLWPLELALHGGRSARGTAMPWFRTPVPEHYRDFNELLDVYMQLTAELFSHMAAICRLKARELGRQFPNPWLTGLLRGGVASGLDRAAGGAKFQTATAEAFGLVNAADALFAIRELVFRGHKYSLAELVRAADEDFSGRSALAAELRRLPKYGSDHAEADAMTVRLAEFFAGMVTRHSDAFLEFLPSFHTLISHVSAGRLHGASLDGRRKGEALAKNVGIGPETPCAGHTALMASAAKIPQVRFSGGQALDISMPGADLATPEGRLQLRRLLDTYFSLGGLQVQINGLSAAELRQAIEAPSEHQELVVRIAGFSDYFTRLSDEVQHEMVHRMEKGI